MRDEYSYEMEGEGDGKVEISYIYPESTIGIRNQRFLYDSWIVRREPRITVGSRVGG